MPRREFEPVPSEAWGSGRSSRVIGPPRARSTIARIVDHLELRLGTCQQAFGIPSLRRRLVGSTVSHDTAEAAMYEKILSSRGRQRGVHRRFERSRPDGEGARRQASAASYRKAPVLDYGFSTADFSRQDVIAKMCKVGKKILGKAEAAVRERGLTPECMLLNPREARPGTSSSIRRGNGLRT